MRSLSLPVILATAATVAGSAAADSPISCYFEGIGDAPVTEAKASIDPVCWQDGCASSCNGGCADACCDDASGCCGDACGCASACGGPAPCCENCGLLGYGVLTYDPCAEGCPLPELLLGFFCTSERGFDDFISPMTNPVFFEDPRNVTELRGIFLEHTVPDSALGGNIQLYAMQIRARLAERLSLIATKDGYAVSTNPLIEDGWADVDLGLKYALFRDVKNQQLLSAGFTYNLPVGSTRTRQAVGDGAFHLFATGGTQLGRCSHWLSAFGGIIPVDQDANRSFVYWSNHFDYQIRKGWYALMEYSWYHDAVDGGSGGAGLVGLDGGDLFNLGSTGVAGNDIVTGAWGFKYKPNRKTELGCAIEVPLTERRDVLASRLTIDAIFRY